MKTKKTKKKLTLNKLSIVRLDSDELSGVNGGGTTSILVSLTCSTSVVVSWDRECPDTTP